jgi:tetratricopeptide (TPR) repeat protein
MPYKAFPILYLTYRLNFPNNNTKFLVLVPCGASYSLFEIYGILMVKALAQKRVSGGKSAKKGRPVKKMASLKPPDRSSSRKSVLKAKSPKGKTKAESTSKIRKRSIRSEGVIREQPRDKKSVSRKSTAPLGSVPNRQEAPRLLRRTKATAAALALLERGIALIYQKNYKKALVELRELLAVFPAEREIIARAQSYIQICDREETAQQKAAISNDQLYSLGVVEHNKANYDKAISYYLQSLENHPDADYIYYSVAASLAKKGDSVKSIENLRKAIDLNADSRIYAKNDADFASLLNNEEFAELIGVNQQPSSEQQ